MFGHISLVGHVFHVKVVALNRCPSGIASAVDCGLRRQSWLSRMGAGLRTPLVEQYLATKSDADYHRLELNPGAQTPYTSAVENHRVTPTKTQ